MTSSPNDRSHAFDLYRAIAVLLVVIEHAMSLLPKSLHFLTAITFFGVPIFFIISGYLLAASYAALQKRHQQQRRVLSLFFSKRFWRIYPAYIVSLLVLSLLYGTISFTDFAVHALNLHTLFIEYYDSINPVYWSLGVEWQWYLLAPLLIVLCLRLPLMALVLLLGIFVLFNAAPRVWLLQGVFQGSHNFRDFVYLGYVQLYLYLLNFALGIVAYRWRDKARHLSPIHLFWVLAAIAACGVLLGNIADTIQQGHVLRAQLTVVAGVVSTFLIAWLIFAYQNLQLQGQLLHVVQFIALISYSLYIYHYPMSLWVNRLDLPSLIAFPVYLFGAFAVASLSYYAVEAPFLRWSQNRYSTASSS